MSAVERPEGHVEECLDCELKETRYTLALSVSVWLSGAPTCHTKAILLENAIAWLQTMYEEGCEDGAFDAVTVEEVRHAE